MDRLTTNILIAAVIGLILGFVVHRKAVAKEAIHGGMLATALHFLGAWVFSSVLPGVLLMVFTGFGFLSAIAYAITCTVLALLILTAHAAIDYAPRQAAQVVDDSGWTAEKAKSSGL